MSNSEGTGRGSPIIDTMDRLIDDWARSENPLHITIILQIIQSVSLNIAFIAVGIFESELELELPLLTSSYGFFLICLDKFI